MNRKNAIHSPEGISLKEYVNDKFDNLEKTIDARFEGVALTTTAALNAADKANIKAENATEKRFEGVNEFRQTLSDQASKFIIRTEFELVVIRLEQDIKNLQLARTELIPRNEVVSMFKVIDDKFKEVSAELGLLRESRSEVSGRGRGLDDGWKYLIGAVSLVGAILGIVIFFAK